jgi:glycosyltransferase involved in cell wall biosynthesis/predicted metal-dependent phosphoesterase TrpH
MQTLGRIDLHVHSHFSDRPYSYFLRAGESAECYTTPDQVYETAKLRGMSFVTITDHDRIDGALELRARHEDTFISEEVSARFPEDGCVLHTIALDVTEAQHAELQRLRSNIYELVTYMNQEGIAHFLCHPLSQVNRRLRRHHLERALLMFRALELINGTRDPEHERCLRHITDGITAAHIERWREAHPHVPIFNPEGRYAFVGGSDDHGRLAIARAYTSFTGPSTAEALRAALNARTTVPSGSNARVETLTNNIYGVLIGYLRKTGQIEFSQKALNAAAVGAGAPTVGAGLTAVLAERMRGVDWGEIWRSGHTDAGQESIGRLLSSLMLDMNRGAVGQTAKAAFGMSLDGLAESLPDLLRVLLLSLPSFLGNRYHARDRAGARRFAAELGFPLPDEAGAGPRVAIVTDTVDDVNGVALGLRRLVDGARAQGHSARLVALGSGERVEVDEAGVVRVPSVFSHRLKLYPQMEFGIPHVTALIQYLVDERIDIIQCATPGPMGIAGLIAAKLTGIPVLGQYHTDVPEYAARLSGDPIFGALVGAIVGRFYQQMAQVLVPSETVAVRMREMGVAPERIVKVPRGIDLQLFRPQRRGPHAFGALGLNGDPKVLYVGRLSKEKGLDALVEHFAEVHATSGARLILVGHGPHAAELKKKADPELVIFAGERHGVELAELYASADVFVFPSETETFGNAVVEAQAAGLPVVVVDRGAARESVVDGVTGVVVKAGVPSELIRSLRVLLADAELRERLGAAAHDWAQRFDLRQAVAGTFDLYRRFLEQHDSEHPDHDRAHDSAA